MTKREAFEKIKADYANDQEMVDFAESELAALDKRAAQAKAYKAKKAAASDELKAKIAATLTGEFQNAETITEAIADGDESITKAKVTARLGQLVKAEEAVKKTIKVDGRRVMGYAIAGTPVEDAE